MNIYAYNREQLALNIQDKSAVVLFSGKAPVRVGDEDYPFTPSRNFLYLTGIDCPNEIFLAVKNNGKFDITLFIQRYDPVNAKWVGGVILPEECEKISGIRDIKYVDEFEETFAGIIFKNFIENVYLDIENRSFEKNYVTEFSQKLRENYPYINIKNIYPVMAEIRRIKQPYEIENIKKAIEITGEGIKSMLCNAKEGMYEYELEAYFDFALKTKGVKEYAFKSIVAAGKNATVLHYSQNNSPIPNESLVLCDVGAAWGHYSGDITRTFPVNGKFTPRQKQIYNIVLEGQKRVIEHIRPGVEFSSLNKVLIEYYEQKLAEIGLITHKEQVSDYYYHGVSHMLGLETHDAGRHNEGILKEGMVLTVEPGLYLEEEGIGIRIEDDVVVTKEGCRIIYDNIPKTVEEIENFMAGNENV